MMADGVGDPVHPDPHDLERFLLGELPRSKTKSVTAHLMRGCPRCRKRIAPLAAALFGHAGERLHLPGGAAIDYDDAISSAFQKAGGAHGAGEDDLPPWSEAPGAAGPLPGARSIHHDRERCESLLERCFELRQRDPEALVLTATLAVNLADRIGAEAGGPDVVDLRARSWAELGNALRVAHDLPGAEAALARSLEIAGAGSGESLLLARQMDLAASLLRDRRRFGEAEALLECAREIYESLGAEHAEARALIGRGLAGGGGEESAAGAEEAPRRLEAGLRGVDPQREPQTALASLHGLVWCLVDCGDLPLARRLFAITRDLYARSGCPMVALRARWLEAKILGGLGDDGTAAALLREVRERFSTAERFDDSALATLDLAEILLRQGAGKEAERLLDETAGAFRERRAGREAGAALRRLLRQGEGEELTVPLLRQAGRNLREHSAS